MGMNEYDRIRSKNATHNIAYDEIKRMKSIGLNNNDIIAICKNHLNFSGTYIRNEIYSTIIKIVEGARDEQEY